MKVQFSETWNQQAVVWSFGLRWYALLEANAQAQAYRLIKQLGAQSWVLTGEQMCSVGLSTQRVRRSGHPVYLAAAAFFARINKEQKVAAIIRLPTGHYWFAAAQKGRVLVRGDQCFERLEQAQSFMAEVLADNPKLRCLHGSTAYIDWSALIEPVAGGEWIEQTRLRPRQRIQRRRLIAGLLLGGGALLYYGAVGWTARQAAGVLNKEVETAADHPPLLLELHPRAVLQPLLEFLYTLPVHAQGWLLSHASCQLQQSLAGWHCTADYQKQQQSADAHYFLSQQDWETQIQVIDLDTIRVHFPVVALGSDRWAPVGQRTQLQFLSYLHKQRVAFLSLSYQPKQWTLAEWPNRSPVRIQGPLRFAHLWYDAPAHIHWYRAVLQVHPPTELSLKHSQLHLTLEGAVDDASLY